MLNTSVDGQTDKGEHLGPRTLTELMASPGTQSITKAHSFFLISFFRHLPERWVQNRRVTVKDAIVMSTKTNGKKKFTFHIFFFSFSSS